jgi:hypothetical protein
LAGFNDLIQVNGDLVINGAGCDQSAGLLQLGVPYQFANHGQPDRNGDGVVANNYLLP